MDVISYVMGVQAGKRSGGGSGEGGAELNIAYGDTAPEDTTKLWVKTSEQSKVNVTPELEIGSGGQEESIETLALSSMNKVRYPSTALVGDTIYVFGGYFSSSTTANSAKYNMNTLTKEAITALPSKMMSAGCASVGTNIYLFGGTRSYSASDLVSTVYKFDTTTGTYTTLPLTYTYANGGVARIGCVTIGDKIYLLGGEGNNAGTLVGINFVTIFDATTESYVTGTNLSLPAPAQYPLCGAVGEKIYIINGTSVYCLDTKTNTITTLDVTLPLGINNSTCSTINGKIYIFGGRIPPDTDEIFIFDTETLTFTTSALRLETVAFGWASQAYNDAVYIFGGYSVSIQKYTPFMGSYILPFGEVQIIPSLEQNIFALCNDEKAKIVIGVDSVYRGDENNNAIQTEAALYKDGTWTNI